MAFRISQRQLPRVPVACPSHSCPYNKRGTCDEVWINKYNSDANCFTWSNKQLLVFLGLPKRNPSA
jgi:hypothetical protein